jgi:putative ATP-binding cassette transporter
MSLAALIREEGSLQPTRVATMSAVAGLSSAGVLATINAAADSVSKHQSTTFYFFVFVAIVALYVVSKRFIQLTSIRETEQIIHRIRVRIVDKVMKSDLIALERIGHNNIFASAGKETQTISQAAFMLTNAAESFAMLIFSVLYLAWLSMPAFVIGVAFTSFAVMIHLRQMRGIDRELRDAIDQENTCLDELSDFLDGFKEAKVNAPRAADMQRFFLAQSSRAAHSKVTSQSRMAEHFTLTQVMFYMLIATMVFVVPIFADAFAGVVVKTATSVLFMIGSITTLVSSLPMLAQANAAANNIRAMENQLNKASRASPPMKEPIAAFREIAFRSVTFRHHDATGDESFAEGPIDLTLRAGETVFVTGGNGSGKSTMMKLLIGLYQPSGGTIEVDGKPISDEMLEAYRNMFAVVFSDYHLFKKLYGMMEMAQAKIDALLDLLEIRDKTQVSAGEFSTLDLSGGQRKRIALLVALLEDKPVIVLDEWAADQDPVFRRKFYEEMLPELKRQGKTIVAITHDDQYYRLADRQIKLEYGRIASDLGGGSRA